MSKAELKMALAAKRLSMLQDDYHAFSPVSSQVNPVQMKSIKPSRDISNDALSEDIVIHRSSENPKTFGSRKRARVVSNDKSSKDRELVVSIPPRKQGSTTPKRIRSNDSSYNEIVKVTENTDDPKSQKIIKPKRMRNNSSPDDIVKATDDPRTPKKAKLKRIKSSDSSNKIVKATDKPRVQKIDPFSTGANSSSMKRAEEVQANLSAKYPSFLKTMLKSHVTRGFWLGLPSKFCKKHLPIRDTTVVLEDEAGKEFDTNYLSGKVGLSAGWKGFSTDHKLREGDVLIFHLIAFTKFKIYIVREQSFGELDGALGRLTLDDTVLGQQKFEKHSQKVIKTEDNYTLRDHLSPSSSNVDLGPDSPECPIVLDGVRFSDSSVNFEGVHSFENFHIVVDSLIIDSKFSEITRKKYYEICCSQRSVLHEHFLKGLNCDLVVGIISETVNIADAIKSCKVDSTSHEDLRIWEKTLKSFELVGMKVAFLLADINKRLGHA